MAESLRRREPAPVAEVWPERVLQRLVAAGRLTVDEVIDAAAPAVLAQLAGERCVGGVEVEQVAEGIAATWAEELFGAGADERLRRKATDRRRGDSAFEVLRELVEVGLLNEAVLSGLVAGVVEAYRLTPEDGAALIEELFGGEPTVGVRALHEDVLARVC
jgi:small ligand-binding sensory domain FIST